jgi:integrase
MATYRTYKKKSGMVSVTATIRKSTGSFTETFTSATKTKAMSEAKAWAAEFENDIYLQKKKSHLAARQRLSDFFESYFDHILLTNRKKPSTIELERQSRKQLERLIGSGTYLTDISTATIAAYRDQRIREGIGASKIRSEIALISCLFKYAMQEKGFAIENPVASGKMWRPPAPGGRIDFLSEQDIRVFMAACRMSRAKKLAAYVTVLLNTGMRPGEAATLKVGDVDRDRRSIWLDKTKNNTSRCVPLTETAWAEILPLIDGRHDDEYIFHKGKDLPEMWKLKPASMFREPFDQARKAAGLEHITRHSLRHTAATHMLAAGVDIRTLAAVLGHKTLQMVLRYTHPDEAALRKAVDTLDGLVE